MSDIKAPNGRIDRRLIAAAIAAVALTVIVIVAVSGLGVGSASPTASAGATLPPVGIAAEVVADGRALPTRTAELSVDGPATIATVPVTLGQEVAAGTVLVTMDTDAIDTEIAGARAAAEAAIARSAQAEALVKQAEAQVGVAEADLDRAQALLATAREGNIGEDEATAGRDAARAQVAAAKAASTAAREGAEAAAADARRAEAAVGSLKLSKTGLTVTAPFAGQVASLAATVGRQAGPGQILVRIAGIGAWEFETTDLDESAIARIAVGDAATVTLDGVPGVSIPATVARIGSFGESRQGGIVYQVVATPNGTVPEGIRWNMTATISIKTDR